MTSPSRAKGKRGELDAVGALRALGYPARRRLLNGRRDDQGDIDGVPFTTVEVKSHADLAAAIREGLNDLSREQEAAGTPYGAVFIRRRGGRFVVVMDVGGWGDLLRDAIAHRTRKGEP